MFRAAASCSKQLMKAGVQKQLPTVTCTKNVHILLGHKDPEPPEVFDQRFVDFFNRTDIDGWDLRRGLAELHAHDVVPEPKIVSAALYACRRVNDLALGIRFLEAVKMKCGTKKLKGIVYPWVIQEVQPVLDELGIPTPEECGYDKPELFIPNPRYYWERDWYKDYGYDDKLYFYY